MKKYYKSLVAVIGAMLTLTSCTDFLKVDPEDKILESQVFTNPTKISTALNGIYMNLSKDALYGDHLTLSTLEILAQRYNITSQHGKYKIIKYAYNEEPMLSIMNNAWKGAYANIMNANTFLYNLDKYQGVLSPAVDSIYRGEAIGIRAMLHFDMLRLFGPMYSSADSVQIAIPYYADASSNINPLMPANEIMQKILVDLDTAEGLLKNDPIITKGTQPTPSGTINNYTNFRNYRFNYYAVKALKARVNLYRGNKVAALATAKEVMSSTRFPWATQSNALSTSPDRVFTSEMILGLTCSNLYENHAKYFAGEVADASILAPNDALLKQVFESPAGDGDYRNTLNWDIPTKSGKGYKTFFKYEDVQDKNKSSRFAVPLIKMSEMYYIAAECEPNTAVAIGYINTVRNTRNLGNLAATANVDNELLKEYRKEFYGEGQLFYYYKRRNVNLIPDATSPAFSIAMTKAEYVLPLPLSEIQYR